MNPEDSILIVGASARHLAQSAKIAGMKPVAVDLFGDWDLRQIATVNRVDRLSSIDLSTIFRCLPPTVGFLIGGGMETRLEVLSNLKSRLHFFGSDPGRIADTQCPFVLRDCCRDLGILFPEVVASGELPDDVDCVWLNKPLLGAGGFEISHWSRSQSVAPTHFLQELIKGTSYSAIFVCNGSATELLGITQQLVGDPSYPNQSFSYCGSVGPIHLSADLQSEIERYGNAIASTFELVGGFGIDFIVDGRLRPWLIEINPRITAAAEVLERAGLFESVVGLHLQACRQEPIDSCGACSKVVGKSIVYSRLESAFTVTNELFSAFTNRTLSHRANIDSDNYHIADIPQVGTTIGPNQPVVTVIVSSHSRHDVINKLNSATKNVRCQIKQLAGLQSASH